MMALNTRGDQIVGFFGYSLDGRRVAVCRDPVCQGHVFELVEVLRAAGARASLCDQCGRLLVPRHGN
jgi:hypothetical protein